MAVRISRLAEVDPRAELGDDVEIGPFCVVGPNVRLGSQCRLDAHVVLTGHTTIGDRNRFFPNSVIGADPQDYSYSGAPTRVEIGTDNVFREGVTVNRGAEKEDGVTRIGDRNMLMSNSHVAHNCVLRDNIVLVNGVLLGGHVHVHDGAILSGNTAVHHFTTLGTLCFVSGGSRVTTDIAPYMLAAGNDQLKIHTINAVGMQRRGIPQSSIDVIKRAYRLLYREHKSLDQMRTILMEELSGSIPIELATLFQFLEVQRTGQKGRGGEARRNLPPSTESGEPTRNAA